MAREQLFSFKYDGDTIWVYTAESSSDVYYCINNGSSKSAGIQYNANNGSYKRKSGTTLLAKDATSYIRGLLQ
jgi:hypothetical protein